MFFIKQGATYDTKLGPFVDKGDGVAYETGMSAAMGNATTGVRLSKNGAAFADRAETTDPAYDAFGYYLVKLDATDTNTVGTLKVIFGDAAVCLPCEANYQVLEPATYDALFADAATAVLPDTAGVTELLTRIPDATAGANGGLTICGSNAAATFANLTVSGTSALGAVTATTIGASGAVTAASLTMSGALQAATIVSTGTTTLNALTVTNATTHTGTTTYTGAVTYSNAITATAGPVSMTNASNDIKGVFVATNGLTATSIATGAVDADALAADGVAKIADGLLDRDMSTGVDSGSATVRTVRQALRFLRNKWSISTGTLTVTKENDTTASWTSTLTTDASAEPVTASDPASV